MEEKERGNFELTLEYALINENRISEYFIKLLTHVLEKAYISIALKSTLYTFACC